MSLGLAERQGNLVDDPARFCDAALPENPATPCCTARGTIFSQRLLGPHVRRLHEAVLPRPRLGRGHDRLLIVLGISRICDINTAGVPLGSR